MQTRRIYLAFHLQCIDSALERKRKNIYVADFTRLISHGNASTFYKTYFRDYSDTNTNSLYSLLFFGREVRKIYILFRSNREIADTRLLFISQKLQSPKSWYVTAHPTFSQFLFFSFFFWFNICWISGGLFKNLFFHSFIILRMLIFVESKPDSLLCETYPCTTRSRFFFLLSRFNLFYDKDGDFFAGIHRDSQELMNLLQEFTELNSSILFLRFRI